MSRKHNPAPSLQNLNGGRRLLSLDGGGVRGISTLLILQSLMRYVLEEENRQRRIQGKDVLDGPLKPWEYFDLIGGTNTGGIIALMLGRLKMGVDETIEKYTQLVNAVFPPSIPEQDRSQSLEAELKKLVEGVTGNPNTLLVDDSHSQCKVFVCARNSRNMNAGIPELFRTYHSVEVTQENCSLWEAARTTSAIPGFFTPMAIGREQSYIEGGLGCNNPSKLVLSEAAKQFPDCSIAVLVSIGTGHPQTISMHNATAMTNTLLAMAIDCESRHNDMVEHFSLLENVYHRFNVFQGMQTTRMTEITPDIEAHTTNYLLHKETTENLIRAAREMIKQVGRIPVQYLVAVPPSETYRHLVDLSDSLRGKLASDYRAHDQGKQDCHPMTRDSVLRKVNTWLRHSAQSCLLVTGIAGVGKTAIAITIVECLQDGRTLATETPEGRTALPLPILCAQYFFNHTLDSARLDRLFPTLAVQLAQNSPIAASLIRNVVQGTPGILNHFGLEQAIHFFVNPLRELARIHAPRAVAVVIDGIDELELAGSTHSTALAEVSTILLQISPMLPHNARLLLFTRPEAPIIDAIAISDVLTHLHLSTAESQRDVDVLVRDTLDELRRIHRLADESIFRAQLSMCNAAAGHLGWAKQALRWLYSILEYEGEGGFNEAIKDISHQATGSLDALYSLILARMLPPSNEPDLRERYSTALHVVLGVLVTLKEPQCIRTINRLVAGMLRGHFNTLHCLKRLGVIYDADSINVITEDTIPRVHKSFHDFLLSDRAPRDSRVKPPLAHSRLASACFMIMQSELHFNMGKFKSLHESMMNRLKVRVPDHIQYACLSFHHHVEHSERLFTNELRTWMSTRFMFWLEIMVMSESKQSNAMSGRLLTLRKCTSSQDPAFVEHAVSLVTPFIELLRMWGTLAIYSIAVPLSSSETVRSICPSPHIAILCCRKDQVRGKNGVPLRTFPVLLSPSGCHVAFASPQGHLSILSLYDRQIRRVTSVRMHIGKTWSFSKDSTTLIIAYSMRRAVVLVLVDVLSGMERKEWIVHPASDFANLSGLDVIKQVQISPRGAYVLLDMIPDGLDKKLTRRREVLVYHDGRAILSLVAHGSPYFLDEGSIIFQNGTGAEFGVTDLNTGGQKVLMNGLPGILRGIATSQAGIIALVTTECLSVCCNSRNHGWRELMHTAVETGTRVLEISSDGRLLVLGMELGSIQVWRVVDVSDFSQWTHFATLSGQIGHIEQLSFGAEDEQLVSYSLDGEIRIWNISAIGQGLEWDIKVEEGALVDGSWFKHGIPLGGWFVWPKEQPEAPTASLFQYPFQLPQGVAPLNWNCPSPLDQ